MADITMCRGERREDGIVKMCPVRATCLRHVAAPSSWQSWFTQTPEWEPVCEEYLETLSAPAGAPRQRRVSQRRPPSIQAPAAEAADAKDAGSEEPRS